MPIKYNKNYYIETFSKFLKRNGYRDSTIKIYTKLIKIFINNYIEFKEDFYNIQRIKDFVLKYSLTYKNILMSAIINFYKIFFYGDEIYQKVLFMFKDLFKIKNKNYYKIKYLDFDEGLAFMRFLEILSESRPTLKDMVLLIKIMLFTGLRIGTVLNLKPININFDKKYISIESKGGKIIYVPINDELKKDLEEYIKENNIQEKENIFKKKYCGYYRKIRRYGSKFFNKEFEITPHLFRHTFAKYISDKYGILIAKELLHHSNIHTTLLYTTPYKKEVFDKYYTLFDKENKEDKNDFGGDKE